MSIRSFFGGLFVMLGCAGVVTSLAAMITSMQMQTGKGLMLGLAVLGSALVVLLLGVFVAMFRR